MAIGAVREGEHRAVGLLHLLHLARYGPKDGIDTLANILGQIAQLVVAVVVSPIDVGGLWSKGHIPGVRDVLGAVGFVHVQVTRVGQVVQLVEAVAVQLSTALGVLVAEVVVLVAIAVPALRSGDVAVGVVGVGAAVAREGRSRVRGSGGGGQLTRKKSNYVWY